jgi:uncharacterized protein (TIGR02594 family)
MTVAEIQQALTTLGYKPGPVDGAWGRKAIAAVKAFQRMHRLEVDGIVGPITRAALKRSLARKKAALSVSAGVALPWITELLRKAGLHESRDNAALRVYLRSDGRTLGDPAKLPWCGDLVETVIALTLPGEALPTNPYLARNWGKFGRKIRPCYGAVGVFSRPGSAMNGHVGFLLGETATSYRVGGGNQSDAITVTALLKKDRLLDARWPTTFPLIEGKLGAGSGGVVSTNEA